MLDKNFKLNIVGTPCGESGYSSHIRQLALALNKHIDVAIEMQKFPGWELQCSQEIIDMVNKKYQNEVTLMIGLPPFWELQLANNPKAFIGYLVWECDTIPAQWADICNDDRICQIWVPSNFVKEACIKSGVKPDKIYVVPHGVDIEKFYDMKEAVQNV